MRKGTEIQSIKIYKNESQLRFHKMRYVLMAHGEEDEETRL